MVSRALGQHPLVVIVGPTASGKTSLSLDLARRFNGEIICADSRTIYKGTDIGTAKPTPEERDIVPHWGLDLVEPGDRFTAADFKHYATQKIDEIRGRGHTPFLVGGTGLYVDAVVFNYQFSGKADDELRAALSKLSVDELHGYCLKNNIKLPENKHNKRYVIRAIETNNESNTRNRQLIDNTIVVGISTERGVLRQRIAERSEQIFNNNVVEEATLLSKKYGWENEAMTGSVYRLVRLYLENELTLVEMKEKNTTLDWRLAKRQLTWLRRNPYITWLGLKDAGPYIAKRLANE